MPIIRVDKQADILADNRKDNLAEISYLLREDFLPPEEPYNVISLRNGVLAYWPFKPLYDTRKFLNWVHPFASAHNLTGQADSIANLYFPQGKVGWGMSKNAGNGVYADDFTIPGNGWSVSFWYARGDIAFGTNDTNTPIVSLCDSNISHEINLSDASYYYEQYIPEVNTSEAYGPEYRMRFQGQAVNIGDNGWKHHAIVQSANSLVWYVNNNIVASEDGSPFLVELNKVNINPIIGSVIDEFGVWNRPLTRLEVSGLYTDLYARQYPFNGSSDSYS